jgi:hypothetical protein
MNKPITNEEAAANQPDTSATATPAAPTKTPTKRKTATPKKKRERKKKLKAILDIEKTAREAKDRYRMEQKSGGVLRRIQALVPRLAELDRAIVHGMTAPAKDISQDEKN